MTTEKTDLPIEYNPMERKKKLIERFLKTEGFDFSDAELLELILRIGSSGGDVDKITADIITKFRNVSKAINAPVDELLKVDKVNENTAALLKVVAACAKRASSENVLADKGSVLKNWEKFKEYCRQNMAHAEVEEFRIFLLDENMHCFKDVVVSKGTVNQTTAYPREIARMVVQNNAKSVILAHNHPSGDCKPSDEDVVLTEKICEVLNYAGIRVFDHLIITEGPIFSFRNEGLIKG